MIQFPATTLYNTKIPKNMFYKNLAVNSKLEKQFSQEVESITWVNKLSPQTLPVGAGKQVQEIQLFEVKLKQRGISKNLLELIDREIPYHIVFLLKHLALGQLWISLKQGSVNRAAKFKVEQFFNTPWMPIEELKLELVGLDMDNLYEAFVLQVAGDALSVEKNGSAMEALARSRELRKVQNAIEALENRIANEKQFNKQLELNQQLRGLKQQLELMEGLN